MIESNKEFPKKSVSFQPYNISSSGSNVGHGRYNAVSSTSSSTSKSNNIIDFNFLPEKNILYYQDFRTGLNTYYDCYFLSRNSDGTNSFVNGSKNATPPDNAGYSFSSNFSTEDISISIDSSSLDNTLLYSIVSKIYIKLPQSGSSYVLMSGTYEPATTGSATTTYSLFIPYSNTTIPVVDWNIDQFGLLGNNGLNPSEKQLLMSEIQQPTFFFKNGKSGGVVFGFTINGVFYPAHSIDDITPLGSLNLPIRRDGIKEIEESINVFYNRVGPSDDNTGIFFVARTEQTQLGTLSLKINETTAFTSAAPGISKQFPFCSDLVTNPPALPIYTTLPGNGVGRIIMRLHVNRSPIGRTNYPKGIAIIDKIDVSALSNLTGTQRDGARQEGVLFQVYYSLNNAQGVGNFESLDDTSILSKNITPVMADFTGEINKVGGKLVVVGDSATIYLNQPVVIGRVEINWNGRDYINLEGLSVYAVDTATAQNSVRASCIISGIEKQ